MKTRTRVRKSRDWESIVPISYPQTTPVFIAPNPSFPEFSGLTGGSSFSLINDCVDGLKWACNPVFHEKYNAAQNERVVAWGTDGKAYAVQNSDVPIQCLDLARDLLSSAVTDAELDDFAALAEKSFIAPLPEGMSILNLVIEIIDLLEGDAKQWLKMFRSWQRIAKRFFNALWDAIKRGKSNTESHWLAWNFAIRPTSRDVSKLLHSREEALKALRWLRSVNHRKVRRHYKWLQEDTMVGQYASKEMTFGTVSGTWSTGYPSAPPAAGVAIEGELRLVVSKSKILVSAFGDVHFDILDSLVDETSTALANAWLSMQWIFNPWAITWEATPFSWAADWCLSEKAKLERWKQFHDTGNPYKRGEIKSSGWSVKVELLCDMMYVPSVGPPQLLGAVKYRAYSRAPGLPELGSSCLRLPTSGWKISLLGAVAVQRIRRR